MHARIRTHHITVNITTTSTAKSEKRTTQDRQGSRRSVKLYYRRLPFFVGNTIPQHFQCTLRGYYCRQITVQGGCTIPTRYRYIVRVSTVNFDWSSIFDWSSGCTAWRRVHSLQKRVAERYHNIISWLPFRQSSLLERWISKRIFFKKDYKSTGIPVDSSEWESTTKSRTR